MVVSCLGFLFASCFPDRKLKKPANWKHQWVQIKTQKSPMKACSLQSDAEKGQPSKTEPIENNCSIPAKNHRKNLQLHPSHGSKGQVESLDFHSHESATNHSNLPFRVGNVRDGWVGSQDLHLWGAMRGGQVESQDFHNHQVVTRPTPTTMVSTEAMWGAVARHSYFPVREGSVEA